MAKKNSTGEENVNHYGIIRMRVTGEGQLQLRLLSLSEFEEYVIPPLTLQSITNIEPTTLANFTQQRAQLEIKTTEIDEVFEISKVIIFTKPVATSYPG